MYSILIPATRYLDDFNNLLNPPFLLLIFLIFFYIFIPYYSRLLQSLTYLLFKAHLSSTLFDPKIVLLIISKHLNSKKYHSLNHYHCYLTPKL